jgi:membrane protein implicated in regulation of membrane protease activity
VNNQTWELYGSLLFRGKIHYPYEEVLYMMFILIALCIAIAGLLVFGLSLIPILLIGVKYVALGVAGYWIYKTFIKKNKKDDND